MIIMLVITANWIDMFLIRHKSLMSLKWNVSKYSCIFETAYIFKNNIIIKTKIKKKNNLDIFVFLNRWQLSLMIVTGLICSCLIILLSSSSSLHVLLLRKKLWICNKNNGCLLPPSTQRLSQIHYRCCFPITPQKYEVFYPFHGWTQISRVYTMESSSCRAQVQVFCNIKESLDWYILTSR